MRSFLRNISPGFANSTAQSGECDLKGFDALSEVMAIGLEVTVTGKSAAGAFNLAESDPQTLVSDSSAGAGIARVYVSQNGDENAVNVQPKYLRDVTNYLMGVDPYSTQTRSGPTANDVVVASGNSTPSVFKFTIMHTWLDVNQDNPNLLCPSGVQLNKAPAHLKVDFAGNTLGSVTLVGGSMVVTAISTRVIFLQNPRKRRRAWVGPTHFIQQPAMASNPFDQEGPLYTKLLFDTRDQATYAAAAGTIEIQAGGLIVAKGGTQATDLTSGFTTMSKPPDPRNGYDITRSNKVVGELGRTPLVWTSGAVSADDTESSVIEGYRRITQATESHGTLVHCFVGPMDSASAIDTINKIAPGSEAAGVAFADLAVRGGSGGPLARFKSRWMCKMSAPALE